MLLPGIVVGAIAAGALASRIRSQGGWRPELPHTVNREQVAVWAVIGGGYAALVTSRNSGTGFELPLVLLLVAAIAAAGSQLGPRSRVVVGRFAVVAALANVALMGNVQAGSSIEFQSQEDTISFSAFLFGDRYQPPAAIDTTDPWLLADPSDRQRVGDAWWAVHLELSHLLSGYQDQTEFLHQTITGSSPLMSHNTIEFAQELTAAPATSSDAPDTTGDISEVALSPRVGPSPRVLIVIRSLSGAPVVRVGHLVGVLPGRSGR